MLWPLCKQMYIFFYIDISLINNNVPQQVWQSKLWEHNFGLLLLILYGIEVDVGFNFSMWLGKRWCHNERSVLCPRRRNRPSSLFQRLCQLATFRPLNMDILLSTLIVFHFKKKQHFAGLPVAHISQWVDVTLVATQHSVFSGAHAGRGLGGDGWTEYTYPPTQTSTWILMGSLLGECSRV